MDKYGWIAALMLSLLATEAMAMSGGGSGSADQFSDADLTVSCAEIHYYNSDKINGSSNDCSLGRYMVTAYKNANHDMEASQSYSAVRDGFASSTTFISGSNQSGQIALKISHSYRLPTLKEVSQVAAFSGTVQLFNNTSVINNWLRTGDGSGYVNGFLVTSTFDPSGQVYALDTTTKSTVLIDPEAVFDNSGTATRPLYALGVSDFFQIVNPATGKCLQVSTAAIGGTSGGSRQEVTPVICNDHTVAQRWQLSGPVNGDEYYLVSQYRDANGYTPCGDSGGSYEANRYFYSFGCVVSENLRWTYNANGTLETAGTKSSTNASTGDLGVLYATMSADTNRVEISPLINAGGDPDPRQVWVFQY